MEKLDRYLGAIFGLAVGDALGTTIEFSPPGTFEPLTDMVGGGPFGLEIGQWTDDTSLALCLAESLVEKGKFDPADQLERYVRWYREGHLSSTGRCFDIGGTTSQALRNFERTRNPFSGPTDSRSAGNGSLMRLAPVPLFFANDPAFGISMSGESSRTTHGNILCIDACRYFGGLIIGAVNGASKEELLSERYSPVPDYWKLNPLVNEVDEVACGSFMRKEPPQIKGAGYVVRSLEAALWAFYKTNTFEEGCLLAVNLGDDADTTGAIYGQIAGVFYGIDEIPRNWVERITLKSTIQKLAQGIFLDRGGIMDSSSRSKGGKSDFIVWGEGVLNNVEEWVSIGKEQITRYHEQALDITNRFFETSPESNERLKKTLVRVPREDLADLFDRHGVTAGSPAKEIAELIDIIRKDGSNSIVTYVGRLGEGVNYDEIVRDVADKVGVKFDPKKITNEVELELMIIQRIVEETVRKLTPEQRQDIDMQLEKLGHEHQQAWHQFLEAGGAGALTVLRIFGPRIMFQVLKSFLMTFMGWRAAGFLAYRAVGLAIPFLNIVLWGWLVIDLAGPAYRKTVPTVFQIGLMRLEYGEEVES